MTEFSSNNGNLSYLLKLLLETAQKNAAREKQGHRFDLEMKYFSTYLFLIAGPFAYEFLYANLKPALLSQSAVDRTLASCAAPVTEGKFRFHELLAFLNDHNLPKKVVISEDGTRVIQRFSYDLASDQIIGPVPPLAENGVPIMGSFPASSAAMIATHFEKNSPASSAYAIMAQPLQGGSPSFCLCLFGTDNKFTTEHVFKRWAYINEELKKIGIECIAFASDGDPKLLSAMQLKMFKDVPPFLDEFKDFFFASSGQEFFVMQDFVHTVNKFRSRLTPTHYLPIGTFTASQSHLRILIEKRNKDEHWLTVSDLEKDKMNFNSSAKFCNERVTESLKRHVPASDGTVAYLEVMRNVMESTLNKNLSPLEKIFKIWYAVYFLRIWKMWLLRDSRFSLDNFVSRNLYVCVEIIAHSLILLIIKFRNEECPASLLIELFGSQACENFFRFARSMTSTESTVTNFSMKEFLQKVRRIDMLHRVSSKLGAKLEFPRDKRKRLLGALSAEKLMTTYLPTNEDIFTTVLLAKSEAISVLNKLGVSCPDDSIMSKKIKSSLTSHSYIVTEEENPNILPEKYEANVDEDDIPLNILAAFPSADEVHDLHPQNVHDAGDLLPVKSSHVLVPKDGGGSELISKSLLCWMFSSSGSPTLNKMRLLRVRETALSSIGNVRRNHSTVTAKCDELEIGNWCIFEDQSKLVIIQIIGFKYLSGKNKTYTLLKVPVKPPKDKVARGIGCLGVWFSIHADTLNVSPSQHNVINIDHYVATIPPPLPQDQCLLLSPDALAYLAKLQRKKK